MPTPVVSAPKGSFCCFIAEVFVCGSMKTHPPPPGFAGVDIAVLSHWPAAFSTPVLYREFPSVCASPHSLRLGRNRLHGPVVLSSLSRWSEKASLITLDQLTFSSCFRILFRRSWVIEIVILQKPPSITLSRIQVLSKSKSGPPGAFPVTRNSRPEGLVRSISLPIEPRFYQSTVTVNDSLTTSPSCFLARRLDRC